MADNEDAAQRMLDSTEATLTKLRQDHGNMTVCWGDSRCTPTSRKAAAELPKTIEDSRKAIAAVEPPWPPCSGPRLGRPDLKNIEGFTSPWAKRENCGLTLDQGSEKLKHPGGTAQPLHGQSEQRRTAPWVCFEQLRVVNDNLNAPSHIEKLTRDLSRS